MATEARGSLSLSIAPNVHDPPASSKEPKDDASPIAGMVSESQHSQAPNAVTKGYNAPTPSTVLGNSCHGTTLLVTSLVFLLTLMLPW